MITYKNHSWKDDRLKCSDCGTQKSGRFYRTADGEYWPLAPKCERPILNVYKLTWVKEPINTFRIHGSNPFFIRAYERNNGHLHITSEHGDVYQKDDYTVELCP